MPRTRPTSAGALAFPVKHLDPPVTRVAVTDDGVAVAWYRMGGTGGGPALLLAHATGFHGHAFAPLAADLGRDYSCVAFDERGHGATPARDDGSFDWNGFASDALAVVDAAALSRPLGFGHSAGGAALLLAELARPGTFTAIYCYEPIVFPSDEPPPPSPDNPMALAARRRRDLFPSKDAAYENYSSKPPMATFHPDALRAYVDHGFEPAGGGRGDGGVRLRCRPEWEARTYEMGSRHGTFSRLGEVTCPVTIAWGSETTTFWPGAFEAQVARLRIGRGERLDGLGHFGPFEAPAAVAESARRAFAT